MRIYENSRLEDYTNDENCSDCLYFRGKSRYRRHGCTRMSRFCEKNKRDVLANERLSEKGVK